MLGKEEALARGETKSKSKGEGAGSKDLALLIERDINIGRVSPGAWLKQIDLEQTYGVSRLQVRHALDRLAERGHVELFPNRGYRVKEFDPQRFNNIINIRAVLEVAAAELVIGKIDAANLAQLGELATSFEEVVATGTSAEQELANRAFHREMLRTCDNRDLVELVFDLRDRIPVSVQREKNSALMLQRSAREHFEMIDLLEKGDSAGLSALVRRHALGSLLSDTA